MKRMLLIVAALLLAATASAAESFWPEQKAPRGVVRATNHEAFSSFPLVVPEGVEDGAFGPTHFLVQSVAGLAACAVNEGRHDEMVWIEVGHPSLHLNPAYAELRERAMERLGAEDRGALTPWGLVRRFRDAGVIKGYILYRHDRSPGGFEQLRPGMDQSVNVATTVAGLLGGVLVEEHLEPLALQLGLPMLLDARGLSLEEAMAPHAGRFSHQAVGILDPKVPNQRDYLIAHAIPVHYGADATMEWLLEKTAPLSPVIGWNGEDEGKATRRVSEWALFNTASNRVMNLPVLSAGAREARPAPLEGGPRSAQGTGPSVAFMLSDGDNLSWVLGEITHAPDSLANAARGRHAFSWTTPMATLSQLAPDGFEMVRERLGPLDGVAEFGGGYFFPEVFGARRGEGDWLAAYARKLAPHMQASGVTVLHLLVMEDALSAETRAACAVLAASIPGLEGITLNQYHPYEGGGGGLFWVRNAEGEEIPAVSATWALWAGGDTSSRGGPSHLAGLVNAWREKGPQDAVAHRWAVVHAWSDFEGAQGEMRRGLDPVWWSIDQLGPSLDVVTVQEMMRRLRAERAASK